MNDKDEDRIIREALKEAEASARKKVSIPTAWAKFAALVLVVLTLAWYFRFDFLKIDGGRYSDAVYVVNRWTGTVYLLAGDELIQVKDRRIKFMESDKPAQ